jgi:hypothetical protein
MLTSLIKMLLIFNRDYDKLIIKKDKGINLTKPMQLRFQI